MNDRVTLAVIAKRAGVHVTTVSLALRNHSSLPEATRQRLQTLAAEMGYRPDPALRALVAYRTRTQARQKHSTLAYVTNWTTRWGWKEAPAHAEFHRGAETKARNLGYDLDHFWVGEPGMTHQRLSDILYTRGIKGVIVASHRREADGLLDFDWSRFSAIKIDYFPHQPALHSVTNDQSAIIRLAMRHVVAAGYQRIGFVMHRGWDFSVDQAWTAGFLCEQQNLPAEVHVPMCVFPESHYQGAWMPECSLGKPVLQEMFEISAQQLKRWLDHHRPEVIISRASFVQRALRELGLKIPRDIRLVDVFLEDESGKVAGVRQNHRIVGELATEILIGQLQQEKFGIPPVPTVTHVEGTWLSGDSLPAASPHADEPATAPLLGASHS